MSLMEMDPGTYSGTYLKDSQNINELQDIKEEEQDPVLITFPVRKFEVEDDISFTSAEIDADSAQCVSTSYPENELFDVGDGQDSLLITHPVLKTGNERELQDFDKMKDVLKEEGTAEDAKVREESLSSVTDDEGPCTSRKDMPYSYDICNRGTSQSKHVQALTSRHFTCNAVNSQNCKDGCSDMGHVSRHHGICCGESCFKYETGKNEMLKNEKEFRCQRMSCSENGFKCDTCSKMFTYKHNLIVHQRIHTGNKPFVCDLCGKGFIVRRKLLRHKRRHAGEKRFECDTCGKRFSEKYSLKRHSRIHSGEKLFVCEVCGKAFSDRSNFMVHHSRYHSSKKPFKCDTCGMHVYERGSLERHRRKHAGDEPFICDDCGKCFFDKRDIVKHVKTHMKIRPYVCVVCGKGFLEKRKLVRHQRTNFCRKPLKCDKCGRSFQSRAGIQKHVRTHHCVY